MNKLKPDRLKLRYQYLVEDYLEAFTTKHNIDFEFWVGGDIGSVACFGDYSFNFDEIRYDIDNQIKGRKIFRWFDEGVEHNMYRKETQFINYSSYCMGLRYKHLNKKRRMTKEQKESLSKLQEKIENLKKEIEQQANKLKHE